MSAAGREYEHDRRRSRAEPDWEREARFLMDEGRKLLSEVDTLADRIRDVTCCAACRRGEHKTCHYREKPRSGCCCLAAHEVRIAMRHYFEES